MQLKISSITSLTDARYFSAIGAHYLGFCFDVLNENSIPVDKAREIISWLHEPVIVGEFGLHQAGEEIAFIAQQMRLQEIQIAFVHPQKEELAFQKFLLMDDLSTVHSPQSTDFLVVRFEEKDIDNLLLKEIIANNKVFIETDFTKENIVEITEKLHPYGIQVTCRKEDKAGFSHVDEYAELLEQICF